ncbi:MAG: trypsin-like peptidase domain-containing protein [Oscillospiraceae bacterium]|nr:trypsin-like peptidase domain-containing protein [Oscillospiraceae bacterium]
MNDLENKVPGMENADDNDITEAVAEAEGIAEGLAEVQDVCAEAASCGTLSEVADAAETVTEVPAEDVLETVSAAVENYADETAEPVSEVTAEDSHEEASGDVPVLEAETAETMSEAETEAEAEPVYEEFSADSGSGEYHYSRPDAGRSFDTAAEVNSAYSNYTYNNPYVSNDAPVYSHDFTAPKARTQRKRKPLGRGWLVALCILLSLASGFGGAWAYNKFFAKEPVVITTVKETTTTNQTIVSSQNVDLSDVIAAAKESVVEITTEIVKTGSFFSQSISQGAGSGVIIDSDGYIATCYHVIDGASSVTVTLPDGTLYPAKVYGYDADNDVAVVKIEASGLPVAVLADSSKLKVGENVFAIGNPLGSLGGTVTDGIVSALDREVEVEGQEMTLLQTSAAVNHVNSGGGLFNAKGELIGIVNAKSAGEDVEGLGFAIPSNIVLEVITKIMSEGGTVVSSTPVMGVTIQSIYDEQTAKQYNLTRYGVYIVNVEPGYGAEKAGLKAWDCIVSVDNIAISQNDDLTSLLKKHKAGDVISVQIIRGNRLMTLDVELMQRES